MLKSNASSRRRIRALRKRVKHVFNPRSWKKFFLIMIPFVRELIVNFINRRR